MSLKQLRFVKINPAGNVTILYQIEDIDKKDIQKVSKISMDKLNLYAEQVGFINKTHLEMMGGEFCGNACRSFASYLAFKDTEFKNEKVYTITCSGENVSLDVNVRALESKEMFLAKIKMPKNISIKMLNFDEENKENKVCEVHFSGITHFIVESLTDYKDEKIICKIREYCKKKNCFTFGIMFLNLETLYMRPYVEVQDFGGVWENSCGSWNTAVGYYLKEYKDIDFAKIIQPGGWLEVSFKENEVFIDGLVKIIAEGVSYIDL